MRSLKLLSPLIIFSKIGQKMHFSWVIFFNSANIRYLFLLMPVISAKVHKAVTNPGCTKVCFMLNGLLKIQTSHFRYFHCSNFKITFEGSFIEKSCHFELLPDLYYVAKYDVLLTVVSKMVVLWIITKI